MAMVPSGSKYTASERWILITQWVGEAWELVSSELKESIVRSFRKCGITIALNGSEDCDINIRGLEGYTVGAQISESEDSDTSSESDDGHRSGTVFYCELSKSSIRLVRTRIIILLVLLPTSRITIRSKQTAALQALNAAARATSSGSGTGSGTDAGSGTGSSGSGSSGSGTTSTNSPDKWEPTSVKLNNPTLLRLYSRPVDELQIVYRGGMPIVGDVVNNSRLWKVTGVKQPKEGNWECKGRRPGFRIKAIGKRPRRIKEPESYEPGAQGISNKNKDSGDICGINPVVLPFKKHKPKSRSRPTVATQEPPAKTLHMPTHRSWSRKINRQNKRLFKNFLSSDITMIPVIPRESLSDIEYLEQELQKSGLYNEVLATKEIKEEEELLTNLYTQEAKASLLDEEVEHKNELISFDLIYSALI
ncbi:hypothetical protein L211DRAFT_850650 [Terfezia boudieri ATCC MYA-4762]|uniref:Uncharacterized protein n=1 Tax=Terfezia boudieri ATCC MYA-4762 TaxID=1051890 RepID=A0A3N4LHX9_9PEZI|nr:hypothetical protein L211DRAFT_850650 [Terfezia boudieri ATCC MYA-4762]